MTITPPLTKGLIVLHTADTYRQCTQNARSGAGRNKMLALHICVEPPYGAHRNGLPSSRQALAKTFAKVYAACA